MVMERVNYSEWPTWPSNLKFCKNPLAPNSLHSHIRYNGSVKHSLLLIEDDADLCSLMAAYFEQHGFAIESARGGGAGLARALAGAFDLIVLDVMLPVID